MRACTEKMCISRSSLIFYSQDFLLQRMKYRITSLPNFETIIITNFWFHWSRCTKNTNIPKFANSLNVNWAVGRFPCSSLNWSTSITLLVFTWMCCKRYNSLCWMHLGVLAILLDYRVVFRVCRSPQSSESGSLLHQSLTPGKSAREE